VHSVIRAHSSSTLFYYVVFPAQETSQQNNNIVVLFLNRIVLKSYYSLIIAYDIFILEFIGVSIASIWYLDLYRVTRAPSLHQSPSQPSPGTPRNAPRKTAAKETIVTRAPSRSARSRCHVLAVLALKEAFRTEMYYM